MARPTQSACTPLERVLHYLRGQPRQIRNTPDNWLLHLSRLSPTVTGETAPRRNPTEPTMQALLLSPRHGAPGFCRPLPPALPGGGLVAHAGTSPPPGFAALGSSAKKLRHAAAEPAPQAEPPLALASGAIRYTRLNTSMNNAFANPAWLAFCNFTHSCRRLAAWGGRREPPHLGIARNITRSSSQ